MAKYNKDHHYGILSGRNIDDLKNTTRELDGQQEKRNPLDFALWKKAAPEHIMHWPSPWSEGFPGWHLECSTMGRKYLGDVFDIHGGGMDLMFPHHECEIAQSVAAQGHPAVNYWMHNNMITINGQKMGKSYNNFITLEQFFKGDHELLTRPYSGMVIRLFILQAHYRSPLDFSDDNLQSAEKALQKLEEARARLKNLRPASDTDADLPDYVGLALEAMNDDLNTPIALSYIFDAVKTINAATDAGLKLSQRNIDELNKLFGTVLTDLLGIIPADAGSDVDLEPYRKAVDLVLEVRANAKAAKDWATSDLIRDRLAEIGFNVKDTKNGAEWSLK